jgi:CubicO group peptidase (beta-lactamase class C family)
MDLNKKLIIGFFITFSSIAAGISTIFIINSLIEHNTFESKIQNLMLEFSVPSLAAGIVDNETLVWSGGFGEQPNLDTVYMIGSITKTFTATAIFQLNESGLISLEADINTYLPFPVRNPNYSTIPITPYMLLTHTSGLPTNLIWSLEYYLEDHMIDWINTNLDLGGEILSLEPRPSLGEFLNESLNPNGTYYESYNWKYQPGTHYEYSNAGYQLLSFLIEAITNQTYMEYLTENIFEPLNMTDTGFEYENFLGRNAIPYEWHNNTNIKYPYYNLNVTGAGNLRSTIGDMAKYLILFINRGQYNGIEILESQSVEYMQTVQIPFSGTSIEGFNYEGYGFGWNIYNNHLIGHAGATPGFFANMLFKRSENDNYGMILLFNRGSALVDDENLVKNFIPRINNLIFNQVAIFS